MKQPLERLILKALYRARFEKHKVVEIKKISKDRVWFWYDGKTFNYDLEKFLVDFIPLEE